MRSLTLALCLFALPALAETPVSGHVEARAYTMTGTRPSFEVNTYLSRDFSKTWGAFAWIQVQEKWAEGYVGANYSPLPTLSVGLAAGLEQDKLPWRVAGTLWFQLKNLTSSSIVEYGGSGLWYQSHLLYTISDRLKLGLEIRRFKGVGPKLEVSFAPFPLKLWVSYLPYDPEKRFEQNPVDWQRGVVAFAYSW